MKDVTVLVPRIQRKGNAIPTNIATLELRDAVRKFCTMVKLWTTTVAIPSVDATDSYDIDLSGLVTAGEIPEAFTILEASYLGTPLENTAYRLDFDQQKIRLRQPLTTTDTAYDIDDVTSPNVLTISDEGDLSNSFEPKQAVLIEDSTGNDGTYTVFSTEYTAPDFKITFEEDLPDLTADGTITPTSLVILLHVVPATGGTQFPNSIVDFYDYALIGHAAWELMRTPGRPYYNPAGAQIEKREYDRGIVNARIAVNDLGTTRGGSWTSYQENTGGIQG